MTAQTYQMIFYAGVILAAVFLLISILLWVKFGIRKIIGSLSGRTAKKSIGKMRRQNEESGRKSFRPVSAAVERGTITNGMEREITVRNVGISEEQMDDAETETAPLLYAGAPDSETELMTDDGAGGCGQC